MVVYLMNNRRNRAFTLIELVVVILILGILAALIVPRVIGRADDAKIARAQSDLTTLAGEVEKFRLDCDRYPTAEEGLGALITAPSDVSSSWKGPYLDSDNLTDPWNMPYVYTYPGTNGENSFTISSDGPDKQPNTSDDISVTRG
jgi:general secretion pathway protein G